MLKGRSWGTIGIKAAIVVQARAQRIVVDERERDSVVSRGMTNATPYLDRFYISQSTAVRMRIEPVLAY